MTALPRPAVPRWSWVVVGLLTVVGLLLRLPLLSDALFGDELSTFYTVADHGLGSTIHSVRTDAELTPPLYYGLAWLFARLGDTPEALRLPSLLAGTAAIPLTFQLGVRTVGVQAAAVGAGLVTVSPFLIFYSAEARAYELMLVIALLAALAMLRALDGKRGGWAAYAICSSLALYTHYTVAFVLAAGFVWAFFAHPRARKPLIGANVAAFLAFLPWWSEFRADSSSPCSKLIASIQPFTPHAVRADLEQWAVGHPLLTLETVPGKTVLALVGAGLFVGLAGSLIRRGRSLPVPERFWLVVALAAGAPLGAAVYSLIATSVFIPRNLIASLPGLALLVGLLIVRAGAVARLVAGGLIFAGLLLALAHSFKPDNRRPDVLGVARIIDRAAVPGDVVIEAPLATPGPLTELAVAKKVVRGPRSADYPLLLLGTPSLETQVNAADAGTAPCTAFFRPSPTPEALAAQVHGPRGQKLFLVTPALVPGVPAPLVKRLLAALPPGYERREIHKLPGLGGWGTLTVQVFVRR